jgi:glycosyltransferase involved in cell wall biosynthesis
MSLLHLTYDLRDRLNRETTSAVNCLIKESNKITETFTIDLIRVTKFREELVKLLDSNHLIINTFGFPYGFMLIKHLNRAFKKVKNAEEKDLIDLRTYGIIHSHKLTFEGYIGSLIAKELNIPLMVTLRQTDLRVMKYRPDLRELYRSILVQAKKIIYLLPVMLEFFEHYLGKDFFSDEVKSKLVYLPNIVERPIQDVKIIPQKKMFLTILRMTKESVIRKNVKNLLIGFKQLKDKTVKLKIIGEGDYLGKVRSWVKKYGLTERVEFTGYVPNNEIDTFYSEVTAFVLPSFSESFGMVYAESLLNNTPIMWSKGVLGFDRMFDNVGVAVDPHSAESIRDGMNLLIEKNDDFRKSIKSLKSEGRFNIFGANFVRENYEKAISEIISI